jgi:hypothetical protein
MRLWLPRFSTARWNSDGHLYDELWFHRAREELTFYLRTSRSTSSGDWGSTRRSMRGAPCRAREAASFGDYASAAALSEWMGLRTAMPSDA